MARLGRSSRAETNLNQVLEAQRSAFVFTRPGSLAAGRGRLQVTGSRYCIAAEATGMNMLDGVRKDEPLANSTPRSTRTNWLLRLVAMAVVWGVALYALGELLRAYWAPDACLDVEHGSFDYRNWRRSQEQQDYIDIALQDVPGFWFALISMLIAIGLTVATRHFANSKSARP